MSRPATPGGKTAPLPPSPNPRTQSSPGTSGWWEKFLAGIFLVLIFPVWVLADDVGGMRASGGVTVGAPLSVLFVVVLGVWGLAAVTSVRAEVPRLVERLLLLFVLVLLGARAFG